MHVSVNNPERYKKKWGWGKRGEQIAFGLDFLLSLEILLFKEQTLLKVYGI